MKYVNADLVLPEALLKEIQQYVHGEMIYIPKPKGLRKKWGECSGSRRDLQERNLEIRRCFTTGETIDQLSSRFFLSTYSIKKIVYAKK